MMKLPNQIQPVIKARTTFAWRNGISLSACSCASKHREEEVDISARNECYSARNCGGKVLNNKDAHNCKLSGGKSWRSKVAGNCTNL